MKICGFTIIRNAIKFDYPVVESIQSVLPICDAFYVGVGNSEDDTRKLIESINDPKIKIIDTIWDDNKREGGLVLSEETNKVFAAIPEEFTWAFYIQSDEVLHEKFHAVLLEKMQAYENDKSVEGLLFNYRHFYGSFEYVADSRNWYRNEIRVIRNNKKIYSYKDAQGFRIENRKLKVKKSGADIFHYGWVKAPKIQQDKQKSFHKMWHDDNWMEKNIGADEQFDYSGIDKISLFQETHPRTMIMRIKNKNWHIKLNPEKTNLSLKNKFLYWIEKYTGWRPGEYKNYELID